MFVDSAGSPQTPVSPNPRDEWIWGSVRGLEVRCSPTPKPACHPRRAGLTSSLLGSLGQTEPAQSETVAAISGDGLTVVFVVCLVSGFPFLDFSGDKNVVY